MDSAESTSAFAPSDARPQDSAPAPVTEADAQIWASPGVSVRKRWLTGIGVALVAVLFFFIAAREQASMLVSTLIGAIFIGCFIWYLRIVAPAPFTITLDPRGVTRQEREEEPLTVAWDGIAKIKEEYFKNGTPVSLTLYKRVGERGLHRSWVVYRDDIPRFDELLTSLRATLPPDAQWVRERIHE